MPLPRRRVPELMDNPALDQHSHRAALKGLSRLNQLTRIDSHIWKLIRPRLAAQTRRLTFLDIATGSGDLLVRLSQRARKDKLSLEFAACDISQVALDSAQSAADSTDFALHTFQLNVLTDPLPGPVDIAYCGLFLHHLDPPQVVHVLRQMSMTAACVIVQDLCRTRAGLALAYVVPQLVTRSHVVHTDAVLSVRGAYTIDEMADLCNSAGLSGAIITRVWPERMIVVWERSTS